MRCLALLFCLCLPPTVTMAAEALSGDVLRLDDGQIVRLTGIKSPVEATLSGPSRAYLQSLVGAGQVSVENGASDRYGRTAGDVYVQNEGQKTWLQGAMLRAGQAFVYPPSGDEPKLEKLLATERPAHQAKTGIWGDAAYADHDTDDIAALPAGHFGFVRGKVWRAEKAKSMVYLDFGQDWHNAFTVEIPSKALHDFRKADIDPIDYEGKILRVRGWIRRAGKPMITVLTPAQIEIVDAAQSK